MNQARLFSAFFTFLCVISSSDALSQKSEKVWFDGNARSLLNRDALGEFGEDDSLTQRNATDGYNLVDLNVHVNPLEDIEVFAQLRVRNSFGGFFGAGTDVLVRQLRASGVIDQRVRFNVGDIYLKQSPFTLWNSDEELSSIQGPFSPYRDTIALLLAHQSGMINRISQRNMCRTRSRYVKDIDIIELKPDR